MAPSAAPMPMPYGGPQQMMPPPQGNYGPPGDYCPPDWVQQYQNGTAYKSSLGRRKVFEGGYVRTEYLNWNIGNPGDTLFGAPVLNNQDPRQPFVATDPFGTVLGLAIVPSAEQMQLDSNNGFRGTIGAEFVNGGAMELGAFVLAPTTSGFTYGNLLTQGLLVGTSTFVGGKLANNIEFYNDYYQATYRSQVWGAEGNFLLDYDRSGLIEFRPLVGFKYVSLNEKLHQRGNFKDLILIFDTTTDIESTTYNNLYGPQIGFRTEIVTQYFTLGVEPKLAVTANTMIANVRTRNFRSVSDGEVSTSQHFTGVSPIFEVGAYGVIPITKYASLRVGYNLMYLLNVTRPEDNIYYNDNGPLPIPPDVVVSATLHDLAIQGLTLGAEFHW